MVLYGMKTSKLIAFLTLLSLLLNFSAATIEAKNTLSIKKNNDNLEVFLDGVSEPLSFKMQKMDSGLIFILLKGRMEMVFLHNIAQAIISTKRVSIGD